jgi:hypothetical protein
VSESEVDLIKPEAFAINFPSMGEPMTIRTKGDEITVLIRLTLRPRDNVMNVNFDVSTSGNRALVTSLDKDAPTDFSRYWTAPLPT